MDARIVRLSFSAPVHFGDGRLSGGRPTCDAATLFSALFIEALRMGCAEELLDAAKNGEFFISDAFPFIGKDLYLPKPQVSIVSDDGFDTPQRGDSRTKKAFKKLGYVRFRKMASFLDGTLDPIKELDAFDLGESSLQVKVNLAGESFDNPESSDDSETTDDSKPYAVGSYSFKNGAGVYFVVRGTFNIEPLMNQLQYSGLGGKRNSGYGRFGYSIEDAGALAETLRISAECKREDFGMYMLLSSAIPAEGELTDHLLEGARTKVVRKGGFIQSATHAATPQKKRDLFAFAAGSVFVRTFAGEILDVNMTEGAHPVHRYAKALWMEVR